MRLGCGKSADFRQARKRRNGARGLLRQRYYAKYRQWRFARRAGYPIPSLSSVLSLLRQNSVGISN